jgi:hypothetical protein
VDATAPAAALSQVSRAKQSWPRLGGPWGLSLISSGEEEDAFRYTEFLRGGSGVPLGQSCVPAAFLFFWSGHKAAPLGREECVPQHFRGCCLDTCSSAITAGCSLAQLRPHIDPGSALQGRSEP